MNNALFESKNQSLGLVELLYGMSLELQIHLLLKPQLLALIAKIKFLLSKNKIWH